MRRVQYFKTRQKEAIDVPEQPEYTRCYLGKVRRYERDDQLKDCIAAVKEYELPSFRGAFYEHDDIASFIKDLRPDECALIPRLEGLAEIKGRGVGVRFLMNVMKIQDTCLFILDVDTGIRSDVGDEWYTLVETVASKIMRGRPLNKKQAKVMAAIRHSEPGLVEQWKTKRKKRAADYMQAADKWGNLGIKPAENAISQFEDEELRSASKATIHRIFGTRKECEIWLNKKR